MKGGTRCRSGSVFFQGLSDRIQNPEIFIWRRYLSQPRYFPQNRQLSRRHRVSVRNRNKVAPCNLATLGWRVVRDERRNLRVGEQEKLAKVQVQASRQSKQQRMRGTPPACLDISDVGSCYSYAATQFALRQPNGFSARPDDITQPPSFSKLHRNQRRNISRNPALIFRSDLNFQVFANALIFELRLFDEVPFQ